VPAVEPEEFGGFEVTRLGKRVYQDQLIERKDPRGISYFWIGGPPPSGLAVPGTDFHAVVNRRIAVTPIHLDLTGRRLLKRLRTWDWSLPDDPEVSAGAGEADGGAADASAGVNASASRPPDPQEQPLEADLDQSIAEDAQLERR
jgi:hypothetical protein